MGVKMVVVGGIRYREEDAPKGSSEREEKSAPKPKNKARSAAKKD